MSLMTGTRGPVPCDDYTYPAPFDQNFFLILNISVGGGWPGYPDETTVFPQQMVVDYVRVYQKINILTGKNRQRKK